MKVVAIINHKGGVGKTTLTANLGAGLAARGQRVLLIDLDSQASLTVSFFTQNEWTDELLPTKTIKHWYDGLGSGALQVEYTGADRAGSPSGRVPPVDRPAGPMERRLTSGSSFASGWTSTCGSATSVSASFSLPVASSELRQVMSN